MLLFFPLIFFCGDALCPLQDACSLSCIAHLHHERQSHFAMPATFFEKKPDETVVKSSTVTFLACLVVLFRGIPQGVGIPESSDVAPTQSCTLQRPSNSDPFDSIDASVCFIPNLFSHTHTCLKTWASCGPTCEPSICPSLSAVSKTSVCLLSTMRNPLWMSKSARYSYAFFGSAVPRPYSTSYMAIQEFSLFLQYLSGEETAGQNGRTPRSRKWALWTVKRRLRGSVGTSGVDSGCIGNETKLSKQRKGMQL
jgi:hypothetical protein